MSPQRVFEFSVEGKLPTVDIGVLSSSYEQVSGQYLLLVRHLQYHSYHTLYRHRLFNLGQIKAIRPQTSDIVTATGCEEDFNDFPVFRDPQVALDTLKIAMLTGDLPRYASP